MQYFLTVQTKDGAHLHKDEQHDSLDDVLKFVSDNFLTDPTMPHRWTGWFAMRSGEITRLHMKSGTAGIYLRKDIAEIDILSERGKLERDTLDTSKH
jgi:hypothetical protein